MLCRIRNLCTGQIQRISVLRCPAFARSYIQPAFDYKFIRDHADELLDNAQKRNVWDSNPHRIGVLYEEFRTLISNINDDKRKLNSLSKQMSTLAKSGAEKGEMDSLRNEAKTIKSKIQNKESELSSIESQLQYEASKIPNLSHPDTPIGNEKLAKTVRINGQMHTISKIPANDGDLTLLSDKQFKDHYDLAIALGIVDMEAGAKTAGSRFHYWKGAGALLELAIVQYAMTKAVSSGFTPYITPDVARSSIVDACGFRPRSTAEDAQLCLKLGGSNGGSPEKPAGEASQIYRVQPVAEESRDEDNISSDPLCLVATAEIPLVAIKQQQIIDANMLPQSYVGTSHCFRAEAGARGRDTRGVYRLHQFTKVEMVSLTLPEDSNAELKRLVDFQSSIYADLGLTFRVLQMPSFELGASAYQKFDIEAWMPGRKAWGEISSASNCTDYQSRRLGIRTRIPKKNTDTRDQPSPVFVHTLNATAVAVPRIVVAILESFQRPNGDVVIPKVLHPWMMGIETLSPSKK